MLYPNPFLSDFYRRALSEMDMEEGGYQHLDMSENGDTGEGTR